uniref:hypothetical protein n=1 Tax=Roseivirga sp. TaxID=1964215 RepID=UPI004047A090
MHLLKGEILPIIGGQDMTKIDLRKTQKFEDRHNGPDQIEVAEMLKEIGLSSLDALIEETVPAQEKCSKN